MAYADTIKALSDAVQAARIAAQNADSVTVAEYGELRAIERRVGRLRHQQWQRDTFRTNNPPERINA